MQFTDNDFISKHFNNFIENADEDQLCKYILSNINLNNLRKKYYSLVGHDFDSLVDDTLLVVIDNRNNITTVRQLFSFFNKVLENKLKDRLKYYDRACRDKNMTCSIDKYVTLADDRATTELEVKELLIAFSQLGITGITMDYLELILSSDISDREAAETLGVSRRQINNFKKKIKKACHFLNENRN